jgi:drug/metabolite transporter (DMT)-like permease
VAVEPTTLASVLGLSAAVGYGVGDFVGGMLSRRMHFAVVSVASGAAALLVMSAIVLLAAPATPEGPALLWGAMAGIGMGLGSLALFRGLGRGRMGVVAPVSAVTAAAIPVIVGVVLGDRPTALAWIGVALSLPAIWFVSAHDDEATGSSPGISGPGLAASVTDGVLAGVGFALLFIGLGFAGDASGLWPVLASEVAALVVMGIAVVAMLPAIDRRRLSPVDIAGAATVGLLGATASVAYFFATHAGLLSIVVVLTSLYPAVTVVLAILVTHEPVGRRQAIGLALACVSIALIVLG